MSGLLQARAWGRSPGQDTSSKSTEAVTEAERSEDPAIYWRRTAGILTTWVCCHDNWLLAPEEHMSNGVTTRSALNFQPHYLTFASIREMSLCRRINTLRKTHWFVVFLHKCVNIISNLQVTFRERRWRWPGRNTSHTAVMTSWLHTSVLATTNELIWNERWCCSSKARSQTARRWQALTLLLEAFQHRRTEKEPSRKRQVAMLYSCWGN